MLSRYLSASLSLGLFFALIGCQPLPAPSTLPTPAASASLATVTALPPSPSPLPVIPTSTELPLIRLLFTGDINPGRCVAQAELITDDFTLPYHAVAETLRAADVTLGSLDGSISDFSPPMPCGDTLNLIGPARTVEGLQFAGFDAITLATNHAKDCSPLGGICQNQSFLDTLHNLSAAGIQPIGVGDSVSQARRPVIIKRGGIRFAFLGVSMVGWETWASLSNPGTASLSKQTLPDVIDSIQAARAAADVVIVLPHWGVEYASAPTADQLNWAEAMITAGATLVIGNHPHIAQGVETLPQGVVAYALGNFVFDQDPEETRQGVVFEADFRGSALESWKLLPVHIYKLYQPQWADAVEAKVVLDRIAVASAALPKRAMSEKEIGE